LSGIWRCIQSCDVISGYKSKAVADNCVVACTADGTAGAGAANYYASDGISCINPCAADECLNTTSAAQRCIKCTKGGGYYENCTACTYNAGTPAVECTTCAAGSFLRLNK